MYRRSLSNLLGGSLLVATAAALNACGGGAAGGETMTPSAGSPSTPSSSTAGMTGSTGTAGKTSAAPSSSGTAGAKAAGGTMTSGVMSAAGKSGGAGSTAAAAGGSTGAAGGGMAAASGGSSAAAGSTGGGAAGGMAAAAGSSSSAGGGMLGGPLKYTDMFTMGKTIPPKYKCPMDKIGSGMGENKSPPLSWTGGPTDTKSFAIVLFDTQYSMLHWAIWDIPATVNALPPEGLAAGYELMNPMGAHQAADMGDNKHAYFGPCSSPGGPLPAGKYEFRLYALKVDKLGLMESSTGTQAQSMIESMMLEKVVWAGDPM